METHSSSNQDNLLKLKTKIVHWLSWFFWTGVIPITWMIPNVSPEVQAIHLQCIYDKKRSRANLSYRQPILAYLETNDLSACIYRTWKGWRRDREPLTTTLEILKTRNKVWHDKLLNKVYRIPIGFYTGLSNFLTDGSINILVHIRDLSSLLLYSYYTCMV